MTLSAKGISGESIGGSGEKADWVFTAGENFGVDSSGNMYANSGKIGGIQVSSSGIESQFGGSALEKEGYFPIRHSVNKTSSNAIEISNWNSSD
jgi:hypothetical protein